MKIDDVKLYKIRCGNEGERGAEYGESQYWGGGWTTHSQIANPMSIHPAYSQVRTSWMGPGQDPYAIRILTDEGITGEAVNYGGGPYACDVIAKHLSRFLIRQDPFNIELIWDQMYRAVMPYGLGGITSMAISGVDLALWDLVGKALKQPVYRLLGGKTKEKIPCYITVHPDQAAHWRNRGFLGVKIAAPWGVSDGRDGLRAMEQCIAKTRRDLGDDMEIMVDCYMSWNPEFTVRLAERVRDYDVKWFEDPLPNGWAEKENRELRAKISPIQLAVGNMEFNYKAFDAIIRERAADIIQPEIQWCGGLTAVRRIAAIARASDMPVIPHASAIYNYHFVLSNVNSPYAEFLAVGDGTKLRPVFDAVIGEPLPENGFLTIPERPGFGVELNEDYLVPISAVPLKVE